VKWHESDNLYELEVNDTKFITRTDDEDKTSLIFGDGKNGSRLPTGVENVKAVYRYGIGKTGNVKAEQISLLATRPMGVKEVINPLRSSGGADRESRDQARKNAPMAVMSLDRLVSVQDYADFARTFAGIDKASSIQLSDGNRQLVHVTVAGADDIPIDTTSDLYKNLCQALHTYGDPYQPIQVDVRELMLLVISAKVRLLPDYLWESVEPKIRAKMLETFSFLNRDLGQDVVLSEVISTIQSVEGIAYVDVDILDSMAEDIDPEDLEEYGDTLCLSKRIVVNMAGNVKNTYHRVQSKDIPAKGFGDTISEILKIVAKRYKTSGQALRHLNKAELEDLKIKVGDTLLVSTKQVPSPAQLAYLTPDIPETLILTELTS